MTISGYQLLQSIFPGIPSASTMTFRHIDNNIYFAKKQFYKINEFTRIVTEIDKFSIKIFNVECSRDGLLRQLQTILRLIQSDNNILETFTAAFYIKIMRFAGFFCSDPFLECQCFMNLAVHQSEEQPDTTIYAIMYLYIQVFTRIFQHLISHVNILNNAQYRP